VAATIISGTILGLAQAVLTVAPAVSTVAPAVSTVAPVALTSTVTVGAADDQLVG
jgi:hypothetical protein